MNRKMKRLKNVHFVGIGGSGMSGIAEVMIGLGYKVQGSDIKMSDQLERLRSLGAKIYISHSPLNIKNAPGDGNRPFIFPIIFSAFSFQSILPSDFSILDA